MSKNTFYLTAVSIGALILIFDAMTPLGVADAILYVALVMLSYWAPDPRSPFIMAASASVLTLVGMALSPPGESFVGVIVANRVLALVAIWISAVIVWKFKVGEQALRMARDELEVIVAKRTSQLSRARDELEKRVTERTADLKALNEELKTFAYIVSHDLRAPLINIRGFSSELKVAVNLITRVCEENVHLLDPKVEEEVKGMLQDDVPEALKFIENSAATMDNLINSILKLSRLEQKVFRRDRIDIRSIVKSAIKSLSFQIEAGGTEVVTGDLPDVEGDCVSMELVFTNIITNAVKYLDPSRPGRIEISGRDRGDDVLFTIRDNGRGIAATDMDKVFQIFRRAGKQDVPGEGMGLAYTQTVIRRHGGHIWLESEPGVGSAFFFTIPKKIEA